MALSTYEDRATLPKQLETMVARECTTVNVMPDTVKWSTPREFSKGSDALEAYLRQPRLKLKELQLLGKGAVGKIRDSLTKLGFIGMSTNGAFATTYDAIMGNVSQMESSKATPYYFSLSYARTRDASDNCTDNMPVVLREEVDKALEFVHAHWARSREQEWGVWFDRLANQQYPHAQDTWSASATIQYMAAPVLVLPPLLVDSNYLQTPIFSIYHEFDKLVEACHAVLPVGVHTTTDENSSACDSLVHCLGMQRCWPRLEIRLGQAALGIYTTPTLYSALVNTYVAILNATHCISRQISLRSNIGCRFEVSTNGSITAGNDLALLHQRWSALSKDAKSLDLMHRNLFGNQNFVSVESFEKVLIEFPSVELSLEQLTRGAHGLLDTAEFLQTTVLRNILVLGEYRPESHGIRAQLYEHYRHRAESRGSALKVLEDRLNTDFLDVSVLHALSESLALEKLHEPNAFANVDKAIAALTLMDPILAARIIAMQQSAAEGVHELRGIFDGFRPSHVLSAMTAWHVKGGFWEDVECPLKQTWPHFHSELPVSWIGSCMRFKRQDELIREIMQQVALGLNIGPARALFFEKFLGHNRL